MIRCYCSCYCSSSCYSTATEDICSIGVLAGLLQKYRQYRRRSKNSSSESAEGKEYKINICLSLPHSLLTSTVISLDAMSTDRKVTDNSAIEDMLLSSIIDDLSMEICFEMHYNVSLKSGIK